jgi:hypothetical protein
VSEIWEPSAPATDPSPRKLAMSNRVKALITSMWAACSLCRLPSRYDRILQATSGCDMAR